MSIPAASRTANIRLTWQRVVGDSLAVSTLSTSGAPVALVVPVYHESPHADPDSMGAPKDSPERAWVEVAWLEESAGRRGHSVVQVDVWCRLGPKGGATSDPFGIMADDIADAFEALFYGTRADGTYRGWIPVLDFATTPAAPTPTDNCLFVYNPGSESSWGQPSERRRLPTYEGFQRVVLRYTMRLTTDATPGLAPWG
jgi:hypothetical protein